MSRHITEIIHEGGSRSTRAPLGDWVLTRSGDHLNRIDKRQIDQQAFEWITLLRGLLG